MLYLRWSPHPSNVHIFSCPATAGSVLRASTGAKVANVLPGVEHRGWRGFSKLGHLAIDFREVSLHPPNAGNFNLAILRDPENSGNVGQSVGVRHGIFMGIIKQHRKSYAKFFGEPGRVLRFVLRNPDNPDPLMPIRSFQPFEE